MTTEEAIKILDPETRRAAMREVPVFERIDTDQEACRLAVAALRAQQERENPKPLTLDELRQMDGEPVWIVEYPDWGHWELSADAEDYLSDRDEDFYGMKHNDSAGKSGLHALGWFAYRHKPEGVTNMTQRDCSDCYYSKWEGKKEPCKSCRSTDEGFANWREAPQYRRTIQMKIKTDSDFLSKAIDLVASYTDEHLDKTEDPAKYQVYVVWYCKTLQNFKALLSTTLLDGMYYEVTYNGDKDEIYLDAYKKFENRKVTL